MITLYQLYIYGTDSLRRHLEKNYEIFKVKGLKMKLLTISENTKTKVKREITQDLTRLLWKSNSILDDTFDLVGSEKDRLHYEEIINKILGNLNLL